ncbi:MAG: PQQ-dependent sugar dehydrogenase, partial [Limibacillus sp.]
MTREATLLPALLLLSLVLAVPVPAAAQEFESRDYALTVERLPGELDHPWGMTFLPDGALRVTARPGRLRILEGAAGGAEGVRLSEPITGLPRVYASGQGGLLDVALDPAFSENRLIYLSYAEAGDGGAGTAVARARLNREALALDGLQVIFRMQPKTSGGRHFGSRLVFGADGALFVTLGDRGERERAQDPGVNRGQVVRINPDGSIPADNPFVGREGYRPEIWSFGHRNPQGAALQPETRELWTIEHGARGGDEVNRPLPGRNYGWPVISYGRHYSGGQIGVGTEKEGMEQPVYYWDPSIAPGDATFYDGDLFPAWQGDLLVTALKYRLLVRLDMEDGEVTGEERLLEGLGQRLRDVEVGPDGAIYLLLD